MSYHSVRRDILESDASVLHESNLGQGNLVIANHPCMPVGYRMTLRNTKGEEVYLVMHPDVFAASLQL